MSPCCSTQWPSRQLEVARISVSFPLPWAISTHSLKRVCLLHIWHSISWLFLTRLAVPTMPWAHDGSGNTFSSLESPNPASCCVLCSLKDDFCSSGRVSPASTYTHLAVCLCLQVLVIPLTWGEHCSCGTWDRSVGCSCVLLEFWFVPGTHKVTTLICCLGFPWGQARVFYALTEGI